MGTKRARPNLLNAIECSDEEHWFCRNERELYFHTQKIIAISTFYILTTQSGGRSIERCSLFSLPKELTIEQHCCGILMHFVNVMQFPAQQSFMNLRIRKSFTTVFCIWNRKWGTISSAANILGKIRGKQQFHRKIRYLSFFLRQPVAMPPKCWSENARKVEDWPNLVNLLVKHIVFSGFNEW